MTNKEKIEEAKRLYKTANAERKYLLESLFPELFLSEDERIRKEIIAFLKENLETGRADETWSLSGLKRWIAWLEKQATKPKWSEEDEAHLHSITTHLGQWIERHPNTCGADIQGENLAWLKFIKQRMEE